MSNTPFPIVKISGPALQRGIQYGEECRKMIADTVAFYRHVFEYESMLKWATSIKKATEFIPFIKSYNQDIFEEIQGIATGSGFLLEEIVAINVRSELLFLLTSSDEKSIKTCCTAVGAAPESTAIENTLLAQNWDWYTATQSQCVFLHIKQPELPDIVQFVEAGLIAKTGLNSAGIGLCTNALVCDGWRVGVPYHAILRGILNADSLAQAIGAVTTPKRASAGNFMLGHAKGEIINIEAGPKNFSIIYPDKGVLSHTNHFQIPHPEIKDKIPSLWPDTIVRGMRAAKLISAKRGQINLDSMQNILKDQFDRPSSICSHESVDQPKEEAYQTNASIILELTQKKITVAKGPPCENTFVSIDINL